MATLRYLELTPDQIRKGDQIVPDAPGGFVQTVTEIKQCQHWPNDPATPTVLISTDFDRYSGTHYRRFETVRIIRKER